MSTNIPKARRLLEQVLEIDSLGPHSRELVEEALSMMTRSQRFKGRGAQLQMRKITPELCDEVKAAVRMHPQQPFETVAKWFGLSGGRVSEIMNGLRDTPDASMKENA